MSPTEELYRSKTNAELKELLEMFELTTPKAKNPFKPNKDEIVQALMTFKRAQDKLNNIEPEEGDELPEDEEEIAPEQAPVMTGRTRKPTQAERVALLKADLLRMERVIVHDTQTSQTATAAITVCWGNRVLGIQNDVVKFGTPWYVRRGALQNLRDAEITEYTQEEGGPMRTDTRKRFLITDVEGWTEEELKVKAQDQTIRNSRTY
jgi:hypothetical protein